MTETLTLTKQQARRYLLAHQGLLPPYRLEGKAGVVDYIRQAGCIQFDPLNIAGRSHELVLQSRVNGFRPGMLSELLYEDRQLVDYWDKNMAIFPLEDWPYFERERQAIRERMRPDRRPPEEALDLVRQAIAERGPLSSLELQMNEQVGWYWAPTRLGRAALETLYFWGELVVHHRVNTRKYYDLAERHILAELLDAHDPFPTLDDYHDWMLLRRIGSIGLLWNRPSDAWLGIRQFKSPERKRAFTRLVEKGEIIPLEVEGVVAANGEIHSMYIRTADLPTLEEAMNLDDIPQQAALLAPLDNLLWDRRLIRALFNFEYTWEVYKPQAQRQYGYYVLPVLYGDLFVARCEPARDKKSKTLQMKNWWWEDGFEITPEVETAVEECLERFKGFLSL